MVLGPMLGGVVLTLTLTNYSLSFTICGVIGVLSLLVMTRIPRDQVTNAPPSPTPGNDAGPGPH